MLDLEEAATYTEHERIEAWRLDCLLRAGYTLNQSLSLAGNSAIDLHAAVDLPARGCSHELAVRILA